MRYFGGAPEPYMLDELLNPALPENRFSQEHSEPDSECISESSSDAILSNAKFMETVEDDLLINDDGEIYQPTAEGEEIDLDKVMRDDPDSDDKENELMNNQPVDTEIFLTNEDSDGSIDMNQYESELGFLGNS